MCVTFSDQFDLVAMREALNYRGHIVSLMRRHSRLGDGPIVDLGAGHGDYATAVRLDTGIEPICVEIDPASIELLQGKGFAVHPDPSSLPPVTALYSINVLEHMPHPHAFLARFVERLAPGASVFIYVPAMPMLYGPWDARVGHFHRFTRSSLEAVAVSAGLQVARSRYADPLGGLVTLVMKLVGAGGRPITPASIRLFDRLVMPLSILLEPLCARFFGKNVWVAATKPSATSGYNY